MGTQRDSKGRDPVDVIDLGDEYKVRQWTEIFDITVEELTAAVRAVGSSASEVKRYVRKRRRG